VYCIPAICVEVGLALLTIIHIRNLATEDRVYPNFKFGLGSAVLICTKSNFPSVGLWGMIDAIFFLSGPSFVYYSYFFFFKKKIPLNLYDQHV
jgi:hypothetical protein